MSGWKVKDKQGTGVEGKWLWLKIGNNEGSWKMEMFCVVGKKNTKVNI